MLRTLSGLLVLVLFMNLSLPAVASTEEMQVIALQQMRPDAKAKLASFAERFGERVSSLPEAKQKRFYNRMLRLVERAETRIARMSDRRLEKQMSRYARHLNNETSDAAAELPTAEDASVSQELAQLMNSAAASGPSRAVSDSAREAGIENATRALSNLAKGESPRERLMNISAEMKEGLSAKVAQTSKIAGRSVASAAGDWILMILIIGAPLLLGIGIGILIGAILIPVILGLLATPFWLILVAASAMQPI